MPTTRTPINRPPKSRITPAAVATFKQMLELELACSCKPIDWEGQFWKRTRCAACETWWDAHSLLFDELHLKPWEWPAYQHPDAPTSYPEGSWAASNWKPDLKAQERYRILCAAAGLEHEDG